MTALSSALWSRFSPALNFVNGHMLTVWFMVCRWPQSDFIALQSCIAMSMTEFAIGS